MNDFQKNQMATRPSAYPDSFPEPLTPSDESREKMPDVRRLVTTLKFGLEKRRDKIRGTNVFGEPPNTAREPRALPIPTEAKRGERGEYFQNCGGFPNATKSRGGQ